MSSDFSLHSKGNVLFHGLAFDYSHANYDDFRDHIRDFPWEDTFTINASAAASDLGPS